jgi:hypothetical protein
MVPLFFYQRPHGSGARQLLPPIALNWLREQTHKRRGVPILPVLVQEYLATLYSPDHGVVQNTGCVKAG